MSRLFFAFGASFAVCLFGADAGKPVDFDREIRPILSDNCFACHGPDEKQRVANLRLDTKDGAFADRGGHAVIVPGNAASSKLYQRISAPDKARRMPPPQATTSLTDKQIDAIRRWIDQGAKWETHWAYVAPKRSDPPKVGNEAWVRNPIDRFILARLEREQLKPSPEADKVTLIRRVTFDLTGLPPTTAEVESFVADKSPEAYDKVVDRLLQSPRYGEKMAMQWLDLARYADTHGYHIDSHRDMWAWRDWVINAFNRNLPYDQFTIEQLAGDLLPHPTKDQLIATGFNRNHMINFEGGAIPEEYHNEYVVDRIEATSNVWMGMTMGCARCHDHKYDPIKQKDFYSFYAFFNNIDEKGLDGKEGNAAPYLQLANDAQKKELIRVDNLICAKEEAMPESRLEALQSEWEKTRAATLPPVTTDGLMAHYEFERSLADTSGHYQHGRIIRGDIGYGPGRVDNSGEFNGETHVELGASPAFERTDPFTIGFWVQSNTKKDMAVLQKLDPGAGRRGIEIGLEKPVLIDIQKRAALVYVNLINHWPDNAIRVRSKERVTPEWTHVNVSYDGSGKASGFTLQLDGKPVELEVVQDTLSGSTATARPLEIGNKELATPLKAELDDLRIYGRVLSGTEVENIAVHHPVRVNLAIAPDKRSKEQKASLREYFMTHDAPESLRNLYAEVIDLEKQRAALNKAIPTTMIMEEMDSPVETFILARGDYRNKGEKVRPAVPAVLPPLPKDAPQNRLGLARWLVDPSHPLTARVAVNRYWQTYFGYGIVKTSEDFGSQGEPPVNQELLDWLATEFIRTGWDIRAMQRLMVTSAAYRQSSRVTPELLEKDPENRLLARGPRFRLPAEVVRDNALAVSGLLNGDIGGPSMFPYQPKGLWEELAFGDGFSAQSYVPSTGKDLYRRSMYTFWKRTAPPPSLNAFDAPDREKCTARRALTNTPLQALVLLNDPTYVEASRGLAQRMILEGGRDTAKRISFGFRLATARNPQPAEVRVLRDIARQKLNDYRRDGKAASALLNVGDSKPDGRLDSGELAAWTTVASVILNLDETITKE